MVQLYMMLYNQYHTLKHNQETMKALTNPVTVETTGVLARGFVCELSLRTKGESGEPLTHKHLLQRITVAIQHARKCACAVLGASPPSAQDLIYYQ